MTRLVYVLESITVAGFPGPSSAGTGTVLRIDRDGSQHEIASGLTFPTGMTLGADGNFYISNVGFGGGAGAGEILKIVPLGD